MKPENKICTKAQLKEYLDVELAPYKLDNYRKVLAYVFQFSENAVIRKYMKILRTAEYHTNAGHKIRSLIYTIRLNKMMLKTGIHVGMNICGKGFQIAHVEPCGFTGGTQVGENCRLHAVSFTMGNGEGGGQPTIGDNVIIGMGSMIIGNVTIADNISIGAGAVVTKSFLEPGITIAGVPAKKISDGTKHY